MKALSESTHAQEHWLRLSADRSVEMASKMTQGFPPLKGGSRVDILTMLLDRVNIALTPEPCAESFELAAAYMLRAAVVLRREETRVKELQTGAPKALAIGVSFDLSKRCISVAVVSGDLGSCELIHVKKFSGTMNDQVYAARKVIDKYPDARVLADSTGDIGAVGVRALRDLGSRPPIEDYIFSHDEQKLIEMNLGLMVKRKALSAPMEMLRDLSGDLDMSALDDVIFALALAVWRLPAPCPPSSTP